MKQAIFAAAILLAFGGAPVLAGVITGTVVDDTSGAALPKPEVKVSGLIASARQKVPRFERVAVDLAAKDDGTFQASDLAPGDYVVAAWSPGYTPASISVHLASDAGPLHISTGASRSHRGALDRTARLDCQGSGAEEIG
jgi:Carboxypeptidase regulatory-like domain